MRFKKYEVKRNKFQGSYNIIFDDIYGYIFEFDTKERAERKLDALIGKDVPDAYVYIISEKHMSFLEKT